MTVDPSEFTMPDEAPEPPPEEPSPVEGYLEPPPDRKSEYRDSGRGATVPDLTLEAGLPANVEMEKTILGAVLLDESAYKAAAEVLMADDFSLDSHRRIFLRMGELIGQGISVSIVTVANELAKHKEVEAVGGVAYLASLTEGLPRRPVISDYLRVVKDKSIARRLMSISSSAIARAADQSEDAVGTLEFLERLSSAGSLFPHWQGWNAGESGCPRRWMEPAKFADIRGWPWIQQPTRALSP